MEAPDGLVAFGSGARIVSNQPIIGDEAKETTMGVENGSDDPQKDAHQARTNNERPPPAESFDTEEDEDCSGYDLSIRPRLCLLCHPKNRKTYFDDTIDT